MIEGPYMINGNMLSSRELSQAIRYRLTCHVRGDHWSPTRTRQNDRVREAATQVETEQKVRQALYGKAVCRERTWRAEGESSSCWTTRVRGYCGARESSKWVREHRGREMR